MLQATKRTSRRPSSHQHPADDRNWLGPSPSSLASTTHPYTVPPSVGPGVHNPAPSPVNNPSMFTVPRSMGSSFDRAADIPSSDLSELMYNNTNNKPWWANELGLPREPSGRGSHHRESSLTSTLGSTEPNSPCTPNIPTPHIAVTDPADDVYRDGLSSSSWNYHLTTDSADSQHDQFLYSEPPLYGLHSNGHASKISYPMGTVLGTRLVEQSRASSIPATPARPLSGAMAGSTRSDGHAPSIRQPSYRNRDGSNRQGGKGVVSVKRLGSDLQATDSRTVPEVPKLDRTMTDVYDDGLYSPNMDITSSAPPESRSTNLSGADVFSQRLHDAGSLAHETPHDDGMVASSSPALSRANQASHNYGALQFPEDPALRNARAAETPQTISPQDSMLDFSETDCSSGLPLFPPADSSGFAGLDYLTDDEVLQGPLESNNSEPADVPINSGYQYMPAVYGSTGFPIFGSQQGDHTAGAPGPGAGSKMVSMGGNQTLNRSDEGGTYSCTYHGCALRFDTPALLQKHKREGHRQAGGMKSSQRASKGNTNDTQAGPHRCYRVNPATGKVCKAVFSRPYDLTRHEDTIHNARKQKVRCDLCAEEKLFSRADALTRHYRVCHPDVELPGKHKRRRLAGQT